MKQKMLTAVVSLVLALGLIAYANAQTNAPSQQQAPTTQQGQKSDSAPPSGSSSSSSVTQDRSSGSNQPAVNAQGRVETRTDAGGNGSGGRRGTVLGMDPMVAVVIGAALLVIIVIALVAMSKGSGGAHASARSERT